MWGGLCLPLPRSALCLQGKMLAGGQTWPGWSLLRPSPANRPPRSHVAAPRRPTREETYELALSVGRLGTFSENSADGSSETRFATVVGRPSRPRDSFWKSLEGLDCRWCPGSPGLASRPPPGVFLELRAAWLPAGCGLSSSCQAERRWVGWVLQAARGTPSLRGQAAVRGEGGVSGTSRARSRPSPALPSPL